MFERFDHYLTYGATDQETARELTGSYDGLVVPGTVAAFQREGTGGFVLSLSATSMPPPYVIDPRFPLFQRALPDPKKSHEALADLLEAPELIRSQDPEPASFTDDLVDKVASRWVDFNLNYETRQTSKFKKYADRLQEDVAVSEVKAPEAILAPYLFASSAQDPYWRIADRLYDTSRSAVPDGAPDVVRVVASSSVGAAQELLRASGAERVAFWVSGFEELEALPSDLAAYGQAIADSQDREQGVFALYGGFFSVVLSGVGLDGCCHGIGYGEHRHWPELPQSGPPPARYYLPRAHRYVSQDLAYQLWRRDPDLTTCECAICDGRPPVLDYHELMKHSVLVRQREIDDWTEIAPGEAAARLRRETEEFELDLEAADLPGPLQGPAWRATRHLGRWAQALELLAEEA
jgi:hypothetical protein